MIPVSLIRVERRPLKSNADPTPAGRVIPRGPIWDRHTIGYHPAGLPGVESLPYRMLTTSGRAALFLALRAAALPVGSAVLVPTYHCPTMIAPVVRAGHRPVFYAIAADGTPLLPEGPMPEEPRAMIVSHYFGLPRSLAAVRAWCNARDVFMIEDCAHALWGQAGDRPVGQWGDLATASLTKFMPVPEAGLLASNRQLLPCAELPAQGLSAEIKGLVDLIDRAHASGRLPWLGKLLNAARKVRRVARSAGQPTAPQRHEVDESAALLACDMSRVDLEPLRIAQWIVPRISRRGIVELRQSNYERIREGLAGLAGTRPLHPGPAPSTSAPYAFALWVDDAERVYHALRAKGIPVYRWDRTWPGTPELADDHAPGWRRHVVQFLCHQSLHNDDLDVIVNTTRNVVSAGA